MSRVSEIITVAYVVRPLQRTRLRQVPSPVALDAATGVAFPQVPESIRQQSEEVMSDMSVSIPLLVLIAAAVYVACRYLGLKVWHAVVCLIFGFLLASTGAAPAINSVLSGIAQWAQAQFSGKG